MSTALGRSLELFYIDGRPDGMLTAEMFNWTGHVLVAPRTQIAAAFQRPEARFTGIYLLLGEQEGEPRAYIGEGEDIGARIRSHDVGKDWWTSAALVTTAGDQLNKAHVRYLEARLIAQARAIGRVPLDNSNTPALPGLSEADRAKMETFIENLLIVLPAVRVDMFIQRARPKTTAISSAVPVAQAPARWSSPARFILELRKHGVRATAVVADGEFIVEAGSMARPTHGASSYSALHRELLRAAVLVPVNDHFRFAQNYAFRSPSAAAAVVTGRSANGTTSWHLEGENISYKEWEARQIAAQDNP